MKNLFFTLIALLCTATVSAQSTQSKYFVYGIDFTHTKVFGADESVRDFAEAFKGINYLLINEYDKYDYPRMLGRRYEIDIEPMLQLSAACNYDGLKILKTTYEECNSEAVVSTYTLPQSEGLGVVLVAKLLNKPQAVATYDVVIFEIATRKVLSKKEVTGEARGFGLRNYWANTVYRVLRSTRL